MGGGHAATLKQFSLDGNARRTFPSAVKLRVATHSPFITCATNAEYRGRRAFQPSELRSSFDSPVDCCTKRGLFERIGIPDAFDQR